MTPHPWQVESVDLLLKEKRVLVQAPPGQGKSFVAVLAREALGDDCLLIVHQTGTLPQWKDRWGFEAKTVQGLCNTTGPIKAKFIIIDEVQHAEATVWSQIWERIDCEYLLGLSATPEESCKRFNAIYVLPWSEAKLPSYTFHYHKFQLEPDAKTQYDKLTDQIHNLFKRHPETPHEKFLLERKRLMLSVKRRQVCHRSRNRKYAVIKEMRAMEGARTLVVSETILQAEALAKPFGFKVIHSKSPKKQNEAVMADFKSGALPTISSVKMLKEGFDCPEIDSLVVASSALSEQHYVQLMGRALRFLPGKTVNIHVFLAEGTSDMRLMGLGESITGLTNPDAMNQWKYEKGEVYSMDWKHKIFTTTKDGRQYYEPTGIEEKIWAIRPGGGKFRIYKGEVLVKPKKGQAPQSAGFLTKELVPRPMWPLTSPKMTFEELFGKVET